MDFDVTVDNTERVGDKGSVLLQRDMEFDWKKIALEKKQLDVSISP
jgi:hypothetical protein